MPTTREAILAGALDRPLVRFPGAFLLPLATAPKRPVLNPDVATVHYELGKTVSNLPKEAAEAHGTRCGSGAAGDVYLVAHAAPQCQPCLGCKLGRRWKVTLGMKSPSSAPCRNRSRGHRATFFEQG